MSSTGEVEVGGGLQFEPNLANLWRPCFKTKFKKSRERFCCSLRLGKKFEHFHWLIGGVRGEERDQRERFLKILGV